MDKADTSSPLSQTEREAQIFPRLTAEMCERVKLYGQIETVAKGTLVYKRGERSVDFFLVLEGSIEIFDEDASGTPNIFVVHTERQFTGELDFFSDRETIVSGRAGMESRVVRVKRSDFGRMVSSEPDIGNILMRAFIERRLHLIQNTQNAVVLIGPSHGRDTQRVQQFLTRNGYPHRLIDSENRQRRTLASRMDFT